MLSTGGVSITARIGSSSSFSSSLSLILLCLFCWGCSTVVQSASNSDVTGHSYNNNINATLDLPLKNFSELTHSNDTRILRRGKRYLEFTKGSRMSWRTNGKNNLIKINTLFSYGYGFRANYPFPDPADQRKRNRVFFKRDLFSKLEKALDGHGFDGRACLLKSFCTAVLDVDTTDQKSGMLFKLLKLIFR